MPYPYMTKEETRELEKGDETILLPKCDFYELCLERKPVLCGEVLNKFQAYGGVRLSGEVIKILATNYRKHCGIPLSTEIGEEASHTTKESPTPQQRGVQFSSSLIVRCASISLSGRL